MRRLRTIGAFLAAGLLAAACSSSSAPARRQLQLVGREHVLTISNESGQLWTCRFNPYNRSTILLSLGPVYEPLVFVNPLQNGKTTPMLATAWTWGDGNKPLTFTIRNGVKWTDGTADDPGGRGVHVQPAQEVHGA